ncbi:protein JINGUBANG [Impatiens glandulifera]|uniref:protein JINGUBANG n=1 Tax=Impatiens glandulifera TaxID=253017 RepID=UPI001FB0BCD3|nr:protein JINGUBANG [Impatiens glandulifera]
MGFLPSPFPSQKLSHEDDSEYGFQSNHSNPKHSDSSSSSTSSTYNSSLHSQPSLPSVPSLSQPNPPSAAAHHSCIATLKGHTSYIFSLTIADDKHLYSGSSEGEIRLWSRHNTNGIHDPIQNIESPRNGSVKSLAVSGGKVFSAHHDSKIRVWKMKNETGVNRNFECVATLPTLSDRFCRIFSSKNYVQVRRHRKSTWVHHVDAVSALTISHDGSLLYSASWDRTFKVWQTSDFRCLDSVLNAHDDAINAIVVSVDGFVYTGSADKKIKAWRFKKEQSQHELVATLEKHKSAINALALSTDGSILYSGACDRSIIVWEKDMNKTADNHMVVAGALRGHTRAILCLSTVGSTDLVFSGSADKTIRIWRRGLWRDYSCVAVMAGHGGPVKCLAACKDSLRSNSTISGGDNYVVYSGSLDCDIREWKIWLPVI